jgi:hypothetical protein
MREDGDAPSTALYHGDNERISVDNLGFGLRALYGIVKSFCETTPGRDEVPRTAGSPGGGE